MPLVHFGSFDKKQRFTIIYTYHTDLNSACAFTCTISAILYYPVVFDTQSHIKVIFTIGSFILELLILAKTQWMRSALK